MSKTKSKSKTTEVLAPNPTYAPQIDAAAASLRPAYEAATANNASLMPRVNSVLDYGERVQRGDYLAGNPHLQAVIDAANRDVTTGVDSRFSSAGRYGSGAHAGVLARALAENEDRIRYGDYATERGYQDQAGGRILQGTTIAAALPQLASSTYADQIAALLGKYASSNGTNVTTQKQGLLGSLLQAGAQAAATYAASGSDRRLKREIERIGELEDGLGVYIWRYIWGKPAVGVMADEVAVKRPWALGPVLHGFATVNYGAL